MADKEIGDLTAGAKPDGTEKVNVTQSSNSRYLTTRYIAEKGSSVVTESTTSRTPTVSDNGKLIYCTNAAATTITLNTGVFSAGDGFEVMQAGAVSVLFAAGSGFTLNSNGSKLYTNGQNSVVCIKFVSSTEATLYGATSATSV